MLYSSTVISFQVVYQTRFARSRGNDRLSKTKQQKKAKVRWKGGANMILPLTPWGLGTDMATEMEHTNTYKYVVVAAMYTLHVQR